MPYQICRRVNIERTGSFGTGIGFANKPNFLIAAAAAAAAAAKEERLFALLTGMLYVFKYVAICRRS